MRPDLTEIKIYQDNKDGTIWLASPRWTDWMTWDEFVEYQEYKKNNAREQNNRSVRKESKGMGKRKGRGDGRSYEPRGFPALKANR